MTGPRPLLSVCMIVKNEEAVLARALASVSGIGAELVVVDTGSTDRSVAIAEAAGALVHHFTWIHDFAAARNHALARATGEWILILDADEEASASFRESFETFLRATDAMALKVPTECVDDRGRRHSTSMNIRLVKNEGYRYEGRVHETMTASLLASGAKVDEGESLGLVHHGYTSAETARKDRRGRNKGLLERAMLEEPGEPRHWHYLGLELYNECEHADASVLFEKMLLDAPHHELAAWSASCLTAILCTERCWTAAWATASHGAAGRIGRVFSLLRLGQLALREGDIATVHWCADELERPCNDAMSSREMATETAMELRAAAVLHEAPASAETRSFLVGAAERYPRNALLADLLVRACEAIDGAGKGVFDAMRRVGHSPASVAAAMDALFRGEAYAQCIRLHETTGVKNGSLVFALARTGRRDEARDHLLSFGESCAPFAVVFGLAGDDEVSLAYAREVSTERHREALALVRAGEIVPPSLVWVVALWLERALSLREDAVAAKLVACLPGSVGDRTAFCALALHDLVNPMVGLELALQAPAEPAALEVIGLVAHEHGDVVAAATMLSLRARKGEAAVRVYLKAADAFAQQGRDEEAREMIARGRKARPFSRGLFAAEKRYADQLSGRGSNALMTSTASPGFSFSAGG